jgi:hypothetical protein
MIGLIPTASGIGLVLDSPGPTDRIISSDQLPVLFISADLERRLRGCVLDFTGPAGHEQFTVDRRPSGKPPDSDREVDLSSEPVASPRAASPKRLAKDGDDSATDIVELYEEKQQEGYAFFLRIRTTGRIYRCEPARDPKQPRYWCFRIFRCLPSRMVDVTERPWLGAGGMTWAEVPAAADAIRVDPNGWLASQELEQLREWMLEETHVMEASAGAAP